MAKGDKKPSAEDERAKRLAEEDAPIVKKGKKPPVQRRPGPGRPKGDAPPLQHGSKVARDKKAVRESEPGVVQECLFPKINHGLTRLSTAPGRQTTYDPKYCDLVIEWSARGKSKVWMAAEFRVTFPTLDRWRKQYPEFNDAFEIGELLAQRYWEDNGEAGMREKTFSAPVWKTIISQRFPKDWREDKKVELGLDTSFLGLWEAVSKGAAVVIADEVAEATNEGAPDDDA